MEDESCGGTGEGFGDGVVGGELGGEGDGEVGLILRFLGVQDVWLVFLLSMGTLC